MQNFIRNSILGIVLIAFILASGGVNVLVHYCNHSKKTDFQSFPELALQKQGCSCHSASCSTDHAARNLVVLNKATCCQNNSLNLKVTHFELPVLAKLKPVQWFAGISIFDQSFDYQNAIANVNLKGLISEYHGPPLLLFQPIQYYPADQDTDPLS